MFDFETAKQDIIEYLMSQPDSYFLERNRTRENVLADEELLGNLAAEHLKCVNNFGNDRDWSCKDACDNDPGIKPHFKVGDICTYSFGGKNKSSAQVEIVKILNDKRGVAEIKFLRVDCDDTGNGYFNYLLRTGGTMNASFAYLKKDDPRCDSQDVSLAPIARGDICTYAVGFDGYQSVAKVQVVRVLNAGVAEIKILRVDKDMSSTQAYLTCLQQRGETMHASICYLTKDE